jgi:murein peptide amidase A
MQRLGKNLGAYHGETIEIAEVLRDIQDAATKKGWAAEWILAGEGLELHTWRRQLTSKKRNIYISTGIHGDEPAGPLAVRQLMLDHTWPSDADLWLCPCLNPTGFLSNRRENALGLDLNREYLHLEAPETRAHVEWLQRQPTFDVAICLHEDWESHGFYLYELNPEQHLSPAEEVIRRVAEVCPIDRSPEIEGRPAAGGIVRPSMDPSSRERWPEAFWLLNHKTRHTYTLEAPSDFPLATRVAALVVAVRTIVEANGSAPAA